MPKTHAHLKAIRTFALSLPGTEPKSPWPGHDDVAVAGKTFLYLGDDHATGAPSVMESYRAQAPKRLLRELETKQPWVAAGALPR